MAAEPRMSDRVLDFEGFPGRWEIVASKDDAGVDRFETRVRIEESGELPPHQHPSATESYEVLSGRLHLLVDGAWSVLSAGESREVPPGTSHAFRVDEPVALINVHAPAMRFEEYFRRFRALKVEYGVPMPPRSLRGMMLLGMLQAEYEPEFIGVRPPQPVFRVMAGLGRLFRYELPD